MENNKTEQKTNGCQSSAVMGYVDFMESKLYILIVMFIIMPMNGAIIMRGGYWTIIGLVLFIMQIPWALKTIKST